MSATTATVPPVGRSYPAYGRPLWQRVLLTRETAVIVLLLAVIGYSMANVPFFDGPLTRYFLLLTITPILLIALPMTMVIVTGEIDLSVASVVGLSSVLVGVLHEHGLPMGARGGPGAGRRVGVRCAQRLPRGVRRASVPGRHHRDAGALPRAGGRPPRYQGGHRLPRVLDGPGEEADRHAPTSRW